jgi:hypothetical protein
MIDKTCAIVIKSSRRPWTLNRLISSLSVNLVEFSQTRILVVDDRTPEMYLTLLSKQYPTVDFSFRSNWPQVNDNRSSLPYVEAWRSAIDSLEQEFVLVLEDDQWLSTRLSLREVVDFMKGNNLWSMALTPYPSDIRRLEVSSVNSTDDVLFMPKLLKLALNGNFIVKLFLKFLATTNQLLRKLLSALITVFPEQLIPQWKALASINPMCGAVFLKEHWLYVWSGRLRSIDENILISRVLDKLLRFRPISSPFGMTLEGHVMNTYVSSMSLSLGFEVDWTLFNECWSQAWLEGTLDSPGYSSDWDPLKLAELLNQRLGPNSATNYLDWVNKFRKMHLFES